MCDYWEDKAARVENIEIPAYVVASYTNSVHTHGSFAGFRRMASKEKWLRVHNSSEWFDYYTPENVEDLRRFFDHYLKGIDNGWEQTPRVRLSVLNPGGTDIVGRTEEEFPLARTQYRKLYLSAADSTLCTTLPDQQAVSEYQSDSVRHEVTYRYRMEKPTELTGYMKLHLWVSAPDHDDMDLAVRVEKLSRDGQPLPRPHGQYHRCYRVDAGIDAPVGRGSLDRGRTLLYLYDRTEAETGARLFSSRLRYGPWDSISTRVKFCNSP